MTMIKLGITQRIVEAIGYKEPRDALSQDWTLFLQKCLPEAAIIPLPNFRTDIIAFLDYLRFDVMIFSNGEDVGSSRLRDELEKRLLDYCLEARIPVLGVCRGLQFINTYFGGDLVRDIKSELNSEHVACEHNLNLIEKKYSELAGNNYLKTNSYHNQGVRKEALASELTPFAVSDDGLVEGFFGAENNILAIQWHPERGNLTVDFDVKMIRDFLQLDKWEPRK